MHAMGLNCDAIQSVSRNRCRWIGLLALALVACGLTQAVAQGTYWRTNYYDITGSSIREIRRSMADNRPKRVERDGLTEWHVTTRYSAAPFQGAYRCAGFNTTLTIRITLPRWTPPENVSDEVKQAWDNYIKALIEHEVGHAQFGLTATAEMHRRVQQMGTASDAESVLSRVKTLVAQTIEEFKERELEYDRLTNHGIERGVVLAIAERREGGGSVTDEEMQTGRLRGRP